MSRLYSLFFCIFWRIAKYGHLEAFPAVPLFILTPPIAGTPPKKEGQQNQGSPGLAEPFPEGGSTDLGIAINHGQNYIGVDIGALLIDNAVLSRVRVATEKL